MTYALPFASEMRLVELGGGMAPMIRPNVDTRPGDTVDLVADFNAPLPIESSLFDGLLSKYSAEHVSWRKVDVFFAECARILKPGGVAVFVLPNLLEQCRHFVEVGDRGGELARWVCALFGDQDYGENAHAAGWSPTSICIALRKAGFDSVFVVPHGEFGTDMIVEARKGV